MTVPLRLLRGFVLSLVLTACSGSAYAGTLLLMGAGTGAPKVTASYTGPADTVASPSGFYGAIAINAAYNGNALDVCHASDTHCVTATVQGNALTIPLLNGVTCASLGSNCTVKTAYDQSGAGPGNCTQATIALRPTLTFNALGTCAALTFTGGQTCNMASGSSQGQPASMSAVAIRTTFTAATDATIMMGGNFRQWLFFSDTSGKVSIYAGTQVDVTGGENTWLALQAVFNGSSSALQVNSTANTGLSAGTNTLGADTYHIGQSENATRPLIGKILYVMNHNLAYTGTQQTNLNTTDHALCGGW